MIIHTVQPGETIDAIAKRYGISLDWLLINNQIEKHKPLVVGQSLVVLYPKTEHTVRQGDDLEGIANSYGVSMMQLLRNNPCLTNREYIYPGETIVIEYTDQKQREISTNGYAFVFIDPSILRMTLPYLTYLTIFYYRITIEGDIIDIKDQELIDMAKVHGVAPIMLISTLADKGETDVEVAHTIFTNEKKQERLIQTVLGTMKAKGYYGLNLDMQKISQEDKQKYLDFAENLSYKVKQEGYVFFTTLTPNTFQTETRVMYQGPEYNIIGQVSDCNILLSYEWGYTYGPRKALPISSVRALVSYSVTLISPQKISIGFPMIGYIWKEPCTENVSIAHAISNTSALDLARDLGIVIERDQESRAPYYSYIDGTKHVVWFRDAKNVAAILEVVIEYNLCGIGTWNIMQFSTEIWMIINAWFEIKKV